MKKTIFGVALVFASTASALSVNAPAQAQLSENYVGPALAIGGGQTAIGADSRFGISDQLSLRAHVFFPNGATRAGAAITYDFDTSRDYSNRVRISPYAGAGVDFTGLSNGGNATNAYVAGGADFAFSDNVALKAELNIPINNGNNQTTSVTLGAGFYF
jgi:hypothetical protein